MNKTEFLQILTSGHDRMVGLTRSKGEEYSSSDDQLGNFRRLAEQTGLTMPQVWLVLFTKHLDAIRTWIKDGAAGTKRERSEPIEGRIEDAILYLYLLRAIVEDGKPTIHDIERILKGTPPSKEFQDAVSAGLEAVGRALKEAPEIPHAGTVYFSSAATVNTATQAPLRARNVVPNAAHYQRIDHPDALHGVAHGSAFVWIGAADSRCEEYRAKCLRLGVRFFMATAEYADDKFGS